MCVLKMSKSVSHICNATSIIKRLFMIRVNRGPAAKTALALFLKNQSLSPVVKLSVGQRIIWT